MRFCDALVEVMNNPIDTVMILGDVRYPDCTLYIDNGEIEYGPGVYKNMLEDMVKTNWTVKKTTNKKMK
jgi:hypothetical protein